LSEWWISHKNQPTKPNQIYLYLQNKNLKDVVDWAPIQTKTASFLVDIGEYNIVSHKN
jgi:hypothetical protein